MTDFLSRQPYLDLLKSIIVNIEVFFSVPKIQNQAGQIIDPVFIKLVLSDLSRWTSDSKGERERVAEQSGAMEPR